MIQLPPGYALERVPRERWTLLESPSDHPLSPRMNRLQVWEAPRRTHRYVLGVDVGGGIGKDRSVIDVLRVGTLQEPDEQVAQFVSDSIDPIDFAFVIDTVGRFYKDGDEVEALAAIEINGPGLATQAELNRHLGYYNLFVWQYEDAPPGKAPYANRLGWVTTARTRPIIIHRYLKILKTYLSEPTPDYIVHSPFTMEEFIDLQHEPDEELWQAAAAEGANDDCIMSGAISVHVAQTLHHESGEPLSEQRRRISEEKRVQAALDQRAGQHSDYYNTDCTVDDLVNERPMAAEPFWGGEGHDW